MVTAGIREEDNALFEAMFGSFAQEAARNGIQIPPNSVREFGGRFTEFEAKKRLVQTFPAPVKFSNPLGMLQGGIIGAYIDDTMGPLCFSTIKGPTTTIGLNVNYLRSVKCPDTVVVEARITGRGRKVLHLEAEVKDSRGKIVATATSSVLSLKGD
ncbi:MAG: PaaI family thioesterase [Spirochaetia bacterium]|nr:PaaI family thioesterase [Spirochaetia bacterium]